jgi:alpha-1,2-glucosyltransferase
MAKGTLPYQNFSPVPRFVVMFPITAAMLAVVHYNTLVHPFTLADNRHYTFYVFRILLHHPVIKYLAIPVYFLTAWAAISLLGDLPSNVRNLSGPGGTKPSKMIVRNLRLGSKVSFVIIWLLASSLSLVTAPLVEPRYFILPWLIWRLQVPCAPLASDLLPKTPARISRARTEQIWTDRMPKILDALETNRLWLETTWLLFVNCATGYIFLHWSYEWEQERGVLQRFMW